MAIQKFVLTHPEEAREIGQIFEVGFSAGGQLGAQAEIGPFKAELSGQLAGEGTMNLAGEGNTSVKAEVKGMLEIAGVAEAGVEVSATLDDGNVDMKAEPKLGPKNFDVKKDLKIGGSIKAVGIGVTAKINVGEAVDAAAKGLNALGNQIKQFNNSLNNAKKSLTSEENYKKEDY